MAVHVGERGPRHLSRVGSGLYFGYALALDFKKGVYRDATGVGTLATRQGYSYTRSGTKSRLYNGTLYTATANSPLIIPGQGYWSEAAFTNLLLNAGQSSNLATQNVTVTAQAYTLSFYGTGTVTLSGASTAGPLVGTGANNQVTLTFTPTAGTLTITVSGSVQYAGLVSGALPGPIIPTTSAAASVGADAMSLTSPTGDNDALYTFSDGTTQRITQGNGQLVIPVYPTILLKPAIASVTVAHRAGNVFLASSLTSLFHRIDSSNGPYTLTFTGANGATYTTTANNVTDNLATQGLTAPVTMQIPSAVFTDTAMTFFNCSNNQLTGSIPSLSANTALTSFNCSSNQLTGSIPSLSANTALTSFYCPSNQLTGSIPSLSANTALTYFYCYSNQLTGSIPSLSANTALIAFYCYSNQLTGSIPSLSANTALTYFYCSSNQLTGFAGGTVPASLTNFQAQSNLLSQSAVDALLAAFDAAGASNGTLNLGGSGNATPSSTGLTHKTNIQGRGWTVTTN